MKMYIGLLIVLLSPSGVFAQDFGDNNSEWAYDGECDDLRFEGTGMAQLFSWEDVGHDATDCRTLLEQGVIQWRSEGDVATEFGAFGGGMRDELTEAKEILEMLLEAVLRIEALLENAEEE